MALLHEESINYENEGPEIYLCEIRIPQIKDPKNHESLIKINDFYMERFNHAAEVECREGMLQAEEDYLDHIESLGEEYMYLPYSLTEDYFVNYNDQGFLSISLMDSYYWGGAHGLSFLESHTFDVNLGQCLTLGKLFKMSEEEAIRFALDIMTEKVLAQGPEIEYLYENALDYLEESFYEQDFYIDGQDLVFYFQSYAIAPYASGFPEFRIPLEEVPYFVK